MTQRLATELALLYAGEAAYKVPANPIVQQLVAESERPLPDLIPAPPAWVAFDWPASGYVDYQAWWREVDRSGWMRERL